MAGIYIHIPFCRSRCVYCGFCSTTRLEWRQSYVDAVCRELALRANYIKVRARTIYIGGGTPSQLEPAQLEQLIGAVGRAEELTMECNPDDVTPELARRLVALGVNRVSMGAQTFSDARLRFLRRRHTAGQVESAVEQLRKAGIDNISVDLMYGFPQETLAEWHDDIARALALGVEHLSAYALMIEEGTPLYAMLQRGTVSETDEELSRRMYYDLKDRLEAAGYEHYEISNFALPGRRSRHNSSYWNQTPYLGLGAAAHSFDGTSRQWNTDNVLAYIEGVGSGQLCFEREELDADTRYNDLVMTALRTSDGLRLSLLTDAQRRYCLRASQRYVDGGLLRLSGDCLRLTRQGLFVSDMVMADLMMV